MARESAPITKRPQSDHDRRRFLSALMRSSRFCVHPVMTQKFTSDGFRL
jgi:hypothetical protein